MNIRQQIKEHLKNREYGEALNFLQNNCNKEETQQKVNSLMSNYKSIEQEMNRSSIDTTAYYYRINQVVMDTLDIADEIIGEPDEDWDFIDDLVSSLKFNLVDQTDDEKGSSEIIAFEDDNASHVQNKQSQLYQVDVNERINSLGKQLSKYEKLEQQALKSEEKAKYRDIIEAINSQIFEHLKKD
ncbi:MAG: hypothetical protein JXR68_06815 [Bacteroidales bacterium]|nr:hypothetical protein [Bacteroidales bacterium]